MGIENEGMEDFYDQPIEVQNENNDELIQYENFSGNQSDDLDNEEPNLEGDPAPVHVNFYDDDEDEPTPVQTTQEPVVEDKPKSAVNFDDGEDDDDEDPQIFKEEDAVAKLKALGYDVQKDSKPSPEDHKKIEVQNINKVISNLQAFVQKDDMELCIQRVTEDLKADFAKQNRVGEIGGEEYELELKNAIEEYKFNPRMVSLEAKTIRNDVNNFINTKNQEKNELQADLDKAEQAEIKKNRTELKGSLVPFVNTNFLGIKISEDVVKRSYQKITSGELAKAINNDKKIQAEVAMYLEVRQQLKQSGNKTFGEGVAAAVHQIEGQGKPQTSSSLNKAVTRPNAGNAILDRIAKWAQRSEVTK